ncbi:SAM-dependent DNA methyltransferase [candidate division WOR-3 bacterium]|nr:SAM-dependent DNA methyltransferase [candidate division WOR-3 bacterium]
MLTDPTLRAQVEALWDKLWSGGLPNPTDAIEQLSFLLFLKRLDEREEDNERRAKRLGEKYKPILGKELRWSYWTHLAADAALKQVKDEVFPFLKELGDSGGAFAEYMKDAEFKIKKPSVLIEACRAIDDMHISEQNQDVQGDLYEYVLGHLSIAGKNGQFRTPRHVIQMMVDMIAPQPHERICDPAAGTCGFLVNAYRYIMEQGTSEEVLARDGEGNATFRAGDRLSVKDRRHLQTQALTGYDSDSGMIMLRIGCMNMILHGIESPRFLYTDSLSKAFKERNQYEVVLANPPFKGAIDSGDVGEDLPAKCKKTEILFLHLFLRLLDNGGRAAVIVPEGILFGSSNAHVEIRRRLIEENRLDAVVCMPGGVFKPYSGVSTAVLLFTKGASTDRIWFYDMEYDGFSLDDKRTPQPDESDIPDIQECWHKRLDRDFAEARTERLAELRTQLAPLKKDRLEHHATIHRLKFEEVVVADGDGDKARDAREKAEAELAELEAEVAPLQKEADRLTRQFWVTKDQVKANNYELTASRYRQLDHDEAYYEKPEVTLDRLDALNARASEVAADIRKSLKGN